jgi:hypothetical protein
MGLGCVKTPTIDLRGEILLDSVDVKTNWVGNFRLKNEIEKAILRILGSRRFRTARVIFDRFSRFWLPVHIRFAPKSGP